MSARWEPRIKLLEDRMLPRPKPDMTGWTSMERVAWEVEHHGLVEMVRRSNESDAPVLPERADAWDAEDAAILAERAATAAADALKRDPTNAKARQVARDTRAAADTAAAAAVVARRIAEEAALRPPAEKPVVTSEEPQAPAAPEALQVPQAIAQTAAPVAAARGEPKPRRARKRRGPGEPKREKQWWEEKAKWRERKPEDDAEERAHPQCLHEYDPLAEEEWDYSPFDDA